MTTIKTLTVTLLAAAALALTGCTASVNLGSPAKTAAPAPITSPTTAAAPATTEAPVSTYTDTTASGNEDKFVSDLESHVSASWVIAAHPGSFIQLGQTACGAYSRGVTPTEAANAIASDMPGMGLLEMDSYTLADFAQEDLCPASS